MALDFASAGDAPARGSCGVQAGGLARSVPFDVLFQARLGSSRLHAPVSQGDRAISRRTVMNYEG